MATLICGSFAYDNIMVFPDTFKNHILPEQVHILNVCFMVPDMRREFGGCAGNIAYSLHMLGGDAVPMGTVGHDFGPYRERLKTLGIRDDFVTTLDDAYTAQAFITTDMDDNQITAFHPGAMAEAHRNHVGDVPGVDLGIVAPDGREAMLQHAREFREAGIPFIFDPGQGLPMFDRDALEDFIGAAEWVVVNDYESRLLEEKTGRSIGGIAEDVAAVIVTRGAQGARIHAAGDMLEIPAVPAEAIDPTGCGDAFRAGLLFGIAQGFDWPTTGRIAALTGAIKVAHHGTQNHRFDRGDFDARFRESFGYAFG